ncbi:MAG: hypothetical protein C0505_09080 [Leptothrix sp. (in: Bacteria)]|nr:hypothetical protein [Leptothrix sp. (in: b-proteobacteria)]
MDDTAWPCLRVHGARCLLHVAVTPNAPRTQADGLHDGCLRVRLHASPVDGKANDTLVAWLAAELGLPRRAVQLLRGDSTRRKQLAVDAAPATLERWLAQVLAQA